jgi:hypothetical protein
LWQNWVNSHPSPSQIIYKTKNIINTENLYFHDKNYNCLKLPLIFFIVKDTEIDVGMLALQNRNRFCQYQGQDSIILFPPKEYIISLKCLHAWCPRHFCYSDQNAWLNLRKEEFILAHGFRSFMHWQQENVANQSCSLHKAWETGRGLETLCNPQRWTPVTCFPQLGPKSQVFQNHSNEHHQLGTKHWKLEPMGDTSFLNHSMWFCPKIFNEHLHDSQAICATLIILGLCLFRTQDGID